MAESAPVRDECVRIATVGGDGHQLAIAGSHQYLEILLGSLANRGRMRPSASPIYLGVSGMRSVRSLAQVALPRESSEVPLVLCEVEQCIRDARSDGESLSAPVASVQAVPGKRLRALVTVGFALMESQSGAVRRRACKAGAAVEMIHEGSLVHDDIVDCSAVRRGRPSVAAAFGIRCAAHVGVYLVARGVCLLASREVDGGIESEPGVLRLLAYSQMLERMPPAACLAAQRRRALEIMDGKTGAMFALAARVGQRIGASPGQSARVDAALVGEFALELARGYQIRDDVLDLTDDPRLGKPGGSDLVNGIHSWPALLWAGRSWPDRTCRLLSSQGNARECLAIRQEILAGESVRLAARDANAHFSRAQAILERLPDSVGKALLTEVVGGLPIR